ncbi:glycoside hydrolase superfamily [Xylaria bambusicola]|uniref:glycoside hydrolase superfamily n=1 Tax=Xylaria bambusicola TaxID=326684 RepID=UPI002007EE7F|nr:glycoside hydrolase superfamily [Xylaria bambusicola]KAI0526631.1 glycoside hydrolase superfamily [Xylaria bambusicola]
MVAFKPASWFAQYFALLAPFVSTANAAPPDDHRVVLYYQTGLASGDSHVSLLPLIQAEDTISATHVLIAALHVIDDDGGLHLNDDPPDSDVFDEMWSEAAQLQAAGVKVMVMIGGAARGSFERLDGDDASFERYYAPIHDLVGAHNIQGLDLDVEESFSLNGIIRLIDRLKADFGSDFIITLAPVASALTEGGGNLSGFNYFDLEAQRGSSIAFYNAQFYFGWGYAGSASDYESIIDDGFAANRVVMGLLSSPDNGSGYVSLDSQAPVLQELITENGAFGGVANWEYFNSLPGGKDAPWQWASWMAEHMVAARKMERAEVSSSEALWRGVRKLGRRMRREAKKSYHHYIA